MIPKIPLITILLFLSIMQFASASEFNLKTENKLRQLEPGTNKKVRELLRRAKAEFPSHKIVVAEAWRSCSRQDMLYKKGKSVTRAKAGHSWHNFGRAVDLYFVVGRDGYNRRILKYEEAPYKELGELAKKLGFEWGGDWKMVDAGHFEYHPDLKISDLRTNKEEKKRWLK